MATLQRGHRHIAPTPEVSGIRELSRADLAHLAVKRAPNVVQTLRDNHHRIARAVASGMGLSDIAATCGVSISRISSLKGDPAFQELVAHYRGVITADWAQQDTVIEFMRTNALKAQAMLSDKLDDFAERGEYLPTRDLLGIAELGLDRTGYGKVNKNLNVNVDFAANLEAARQRSARARELGAPAQLREVGLPQSSTPTSASVAPTALPRRFG